MSQGIGCCTNPPLLTEDDIEKFLTYQETKVLSKKDAISQNIQIVTFEGYISAPSFQIQDGRCEFLGIEKIGQDSKMRWSHSSCRRDMKKDEISYCKLQEVKPINCKIQHCNTSHHNTELWFIWNYFVKGNQDLVQEFETRNNDKYVWI